MTGCLLAAWIGIHVDYFFFTQDGKIVFSTFDTNPIILLNEAGEQKIYIDNPEHIQQPLIQTVMDELLGIGKCPSTGVTGSLTNLVMDQILGR